MIWTLPNLLTLARLVAAPGIAVAHALLERPAADAVALGLFVGAAATDFLDGWLARRLGQVSAVGAMLDPIADKATVAIALAVVLGLLGLEAWLALPVAVILLREVLVSGLREYLGDVKLPVTRLAKYKTAAQMVAVALLLLLAGTRGPAAEGLGTTADDALFALAAGMLWLAAALTAVTGWDYLSRGIAYIAERDGTGRR